MNNRNFNFVKRDSLTKKTRFDQIRLDKNERVSKFEKKFIDIFKKNLKSEHFNSYPELYNFYKNLSKIHKLSKSNFLVTAGIDGGLRSCIEMFGFSNKKVIILEPTFAMIKIYCNIYKKKIKLINYEKNLDLDIKKIYKNLNSSTSLIVISNPNSPTGTFINKDTLKKIILRAKKFNIKVVIDEAYYGFSNHTVLPFVQRFNNLIVLRTFSKAYGLAGLRVGYMVSNAKNIRKLFSIKPMYEINSLGILAANILLKNNSIKSNYIKDSLKGKKYLLDFFNKKKIKYLKSDGNFILFDLKKNKSKYLKIFLKHKIKIAKNLRIKGHESYLRITIAPTSIMRKITSILKSY